MIQETKLMYDTIAMLQKHIDPDTDITFNKEVADEIIQDILHLIQSSELERARKITLLSCCILIRVSLTKHRELTLQENIGLTRDILDGDYLISLYYKLIEKRKEWKLVYHLAPFHKRMVMAALKGKSVQSVMKELHDEIRTYLVKQCA